MTSFPPSSLHGRTALVLGDRSPIIDAVARALTDAGAQVVVAGNTDQKGDGVIDYRAHDIFDSQAWDRLFAAVADIDLVVAGPSPTTRGGLADLSEAQFKAAEANRIVGPWMILKHSIPKLATRPHAAIAMIASDVGATPRADSIADCATFASFKAMFKSAAIECGSIRINAVIADETAIPPDDIAAAVIQIVLPESDFMTGSELVLSAT
jgi:NAD(P)-dependent dehydrogenase (short-subunit alcohol dehydrogenase family)